MNAAQFGQALDEKMDRSLYSSLQACVRCGLCAESCHYYVNDPLPQYMPAARAEEVRKLWRPTAVHRLAGRDGDSRKLEHLRDIVFGSCTMCGRCTLNCPVGVDTAGIMRAARGILSSGGYLPKGLGDTVASHLEAGNNMGVSQEEYLDTVEWMEEQLQDEVGDSNARIPVDKKGAAYLYTMNPREIKFYPLSLLAAAKLFYAAGADWTISSRGWDVTNYALFSGEDHAARQIGSMLVGAARELQVKEIIMAECGHGYRAFRWEYEEWLGQSIEFKIRSFVEVMAQWIAGGTIKVQKLKPGKRVTYHDPCNLARHGGVIAEPRYIIQHMVDDFCELAPHGAENFCCGGGGGMLAMSEYSPRRLAAGAVKARQIEASGAQIVLTACHNCLDQLGELNKHYKLNIKIMNISEMLAEAVIIG